MDVVFYRGIQPTQQLFTEDISEVSGEEVNHVESYVESCGIVQNQPKTAKTYKNWLVGLEHFLFFRILGMNSHPN